MPHRQARRCRCESQHAWQEALTGESRRPVRTATRTTARERRSRGCPRVATRRALRSRIPRPDLRSRSRPGPDRRAAADAAAVDRARGRRRTPGVGQSRGPHRAGGGDDHHHAGQQRQPGCRAGHRVSVRPGRDPVQSAGAATAACSAHALDVARRQRVQCFDEFSSPRHPIPPRIGRDPRCGPRRCRIRSLGRTGSVRGRGQLAQRSVRTSSRIENYLVTGRRESRAPSFASPGSAPGRPAPLRQIRPLQRRSC